MILVCLAKRWSNKGATAPCHSEFAITFILGYTNEQIQTLFYFCGLFVGVGVLVLFFK